MKYLLRWTHMSWINYISEWNNDKKRNNYNIKVHLFNLFNFQIGFFFWDFALTWTLTRGKCWKQY